MLPPIKWVGGKRRLIHTITPLLDFNPATERWVEPFMGGGALFFHYQPDRALLADLNPQLINTWQQIATNPQTVIDYHQQLIGNHSPETWQTIRDTIKTQPMRPLAAAQFLYLNKTAYAGLWRENRQSKLNMALGKHTPAWVTETQIWQAHQTLAKPGVLIVCQPFQSTITQCGQGDYIYADPPYIKAKHANGYTQYHSQDFTTENHQDLALELTQATHQGAKWALSNSNTPKTTEIYQGHTHQLTAQRTIGHRTGENKHAQELLITSHTTPQTR